MILYHISGITRNMMIFILSLEQRFSFLGTYCYTSEHKVSISMDVSQFQDGFMNSIGNFNVLPRWAQRPRRCDTQSGSPWPQHWHCQETVRMTNPQALPQTPGSQEYALTPTGSLSPHIHTPYTIRMSPDMQGGGTVSKYKEDHREAIMSFRPSSHTLRLMNETRSLQLLPGAFNIQPSDGQV